MANPNPIQEKTMQDAQGRLVPVSLVKPIDIARNDVVIDIAQHARQLQATMRTYKEYILGEIQAFVELSAEKYGADLGGKKGNVTLTSFDGKIKVIRNIAELINFDERLEIAKALINECIKEWEAGSAPEIRALINDAFRTDSNGQISTARILGLRRLDISHEKWQQAMQAISESIQVANSKTYIRIYERANEDEEYKQISLDIAKL